MVISADRDADQACQDRVLVAECDKDGQIVLFNWTPTSWVGQLWRVIARHVPPPPSAPLPLAWGDETTAYELLTRGFKDLRARRDTYRMEFPFGPGSALDFFLCNMGPVNQAYASLQGTDKQPELRADLDRFFVETNQGRPESWQVDSEYLRIEARKR